MAALSTAYASAAPLRSLTYAVTYNARTTQSNQINRGSGFGSNTEEHGFSVDDSGTLSVEIVAATADGGLVADVAYSGKATRQPAIRVAITKDGALLYDPKQTLSEPAASLLPFFARETFAAHELAAGATWSAPAEAPAKGSTSYRVVSVSAPDVVVAIASAFDVSGPRGFTENEDGTLTFATDVLAPLRWDVQSRRRRTSPEGVETSDAHLTARLTADSFARRG